MHEGTPHVAEKEKQDPRYKWEPQEAFFKGFFSVIPP